MSTFTGRSRGSIALLAAIAASVGLTLLPWDIYRVIAWPLMLFSTYAHEMGHGVTAAILGGRFESIVINADGSGQALCGVTGRISSALVSAGGLVGPAVLGAMMFWAARTRERSKAALSVLAATGFLAVLLVVRNLLGVCFALGLSGLCTCIVLFAPASTWRAVTAFLAVQLSISVYTGKGYLFTDWAGTMGPSDVANMSRALFLPYWFWGLLCAAFSAVVLLVGILSLLRGDPKPAEATNTASDA